MARILNILGATGSIGSNTLDLVAAHQDAFDVQVLTAQSNWEKLAEQAMAHNARHVVIADEHAYAPLKEALANTDIDVSCGRQALIEAASLPADITMAAIVGTAGLEPTMQAIKQGKTVAFASKECLVAAGRLMTEEVRRSGTTLLPVDSEHNAIFQVFEDHNRDTVKRLILTASGGPFRTWDKADIDHATAEQAVAHPTWSMGAKISVDSATLMNKALEVIEAVHLFEMPPEKVDVVVHPQSVIHSMVEYIDGSILSQMGPSDMRTPIASCLAWPQRIQTSGPLFDFDALSTLTFEKPDTQKFPALALVRDVLAGTPAHAVIFNAVNEIAVAEFLAHNIRFCDIMSIIRRALDHIDTPKLLNLADVIAFDKKCREWALDTIKNNISALQKSATA